MRWLSVACLAVALPAAAVEVRFDGAYQLRLNFNSNYLLDPSQRLDQTAWAEHRLRLSPKLVDNPQIEIQSQFDVVSGLFAGDRAPAFNDLGWSERSERNGYRSRGFDFRYLFIALRLPVGLLQVGQFPNHWGMGLVANSGEGMDAVDFGDLRFGDISDGFLFGTRPFTGLGPRNPLAQQIVMAISGQLIYRDRYASLVTRSGGSLGRPGLTFADTALQAVGVLRWEPSDITRVGFYVARRAQSYAADGGKLHVWVYDLHARTELFFPALQSSLRLEAEGAEIYGGTSHAANLNTGSVRIGQQGFTARATLTRNNIEAELEMGYMSGDSNPFDGAAGGFTANRDYKVGMVLWDEVMLFQTQNAARKLADPALAGRPPLGVDLIPTEGAVTNALYFNPKIRWRPRLRYGSLSAVLGVLFTRAPEPVADPYQSFLASRPLNAFGAPAGKSYGTEVDAALSWRLPITDDRQVGWEVGAQYGVLFPGDVFQRLDGGNMPATHAVRLRSTFFF